MKNTISRIQTIKSLKDIGFDLTFAPHNEDKIPETVRQIKDYDMPCEIYANNKDIQKRLIIEPECAEFIMHAYNKEVYGFRLDDFVKKLPYDFRISEYNKDFLALCANYLPSVEIFLIEFIKRFSHRHFKDEQINWLMSCFSRLSRCPGRDVTTLETFTDEELEIFYDPVIYVIDEEHFGAIAKLATHDEWLFKILRLFLKYGIYESEYDDILAITKQNTEGIYKRLRSLLPILNHYDLHNNFFRNWSENECPEYELTFLRDKLNTMNAEELSSVLSNHIGYINFLYGNKIGGIELDTLSGGKEQLLVYALLKKKKSFIRLVEENYSVYCNIPSSSVLFQPWFRKAVNINSLNGNNLYDCNYLTRSKEPVLTEGHSYTFAEIKELCVLPIQYSMLYNKLKISRVDDKLLILRQLGKKMILQPEDECNIDVLAERLSEKNLHRWIQEDFAHIEGLTASTALSLLDSYAELKHLIPSVESEDEAQYLLRNIERVSEYKDMDTIRSDIMTMDVSWLELREKLDIDEAFVNQYSKQILSFLLKYGADISLNYYNHLTKPDQESFRRVLMAELMGEFYKVKYRPGDLIKEIDYPITAAQEGTWQKLISANKDDVEVKETDGFFDTLLVGEKPTHTCMSYINGSYKQCLLAIFDSNKHIFYAYKNGKPIARALLRLTKGSFNPVGDADGFSFADLNNPDAAEPVKESDEEILTLFLERSYHSRINDFEVADVDAMFIELAKQKAKSLSCTLVLSTSYMKINTDFLPVDYYLYISRSKAGEQYIDSLDGKTTVSEEQSYKKNRFLISKEYLENT